MRGFKLGLLALALVASVPMAAFAQATLSGLVRDTSGAVLPGATVEASSPVLIEKVRSGVTDGTGRYTIPDLRPAPCRPGGARMAGPLLSPWCGFPTQSPRRVAAGLIH